MDRKHCRKYFLLENKNQLHKWNKLILTLKVSSLYYKKHRLLKFSSMLSMIGHNLHMKCFLGEKMYLQRILNRLNHFLKAHNLLHSFGMLLPPRSTHGRRYHMMHNLCFRLVNRSPKGRQNRWTLILRASNLCCKSRR